MTLLTLSPDQRVMALATVILIGSSNLALSSHIHVRWLDRRGLRAVPVHVVTLTGTICAATVLLGTNWIARPAPWSISQLPALTTVALTAGAALVVAGIAIPVDGLISRAVADRRRRTAGRSSAVVRSEAPRKVRPVGLAAQQAIGTNAGSSGVEHSWVPTARDTDLGVGPGWMIGAAVAEECVFRGVVLNLVAPPHSAVAPLGIGGVIITFALSHIFFGWGQVAAKLPLSIVATGATLVLGTVFAAIVGHVLFNWYVWRYRSVVVTTVAPGRSG
ncbi:MAG TPA: CPBP family intramembrane glutamic endopeptidase [Pseudonocardiaceae bacterium]|nr:CPBP family intramembrane glutamic endopeptidase [Pseudonocardiaceae bacterium]